MSSQHLGTLVVEELRRYASVKVSPLAEDLQQSRPTCRRGDGFADQLQVDDGGLLRGRAVPYQHTVRLTPGLYERFTPGAFTRQLKDPGRVKICLEHGQVIGRMTDLEERDDGLHFTGRISMSDDIPEARKARAMLADDLADELSVGFQQVDGGSKHEQRPDGSVLWTHHRARLMEVSLVPWGVYGRGATVARSLLVDEQAELEAARLTLARANAREWVTRFCARAV